MPDDSFLNNISIPAIGRTSSYFANASTIQITDTAQALLDTVPDAANRLELDLPELMSAFLGIGQFAVHVTVAVLTGNITGIVSDIMGVVNNVQSCKTQCQILAENVEIVSYSLKGLLEKSSREFLQRNYSRALIMVSSVIQQSRDLIREQTKRSVRNILTAHMRVNKLKSLLDSLNVSSNMLQLAVVVDLHSNMEAPEVEQRNISEQLRQLHQQMLELQIVRVQGEKFMGDSNIHEAVPETLERILSEAEIPATEILDSTERISQRVWLVCIKLELDPSHPRKVVRKITHFKAFQKADCIRFAVEVDIMRRLSTCPNIVRIVGVTKDRFDSFALLLEYCQNGDLRKYIDDGKCSKWDKRIRLALDIAQGLQFLHEAGIVHKYLNSSHIFITHDIMAKIGNFGLSRDENGHTDQSVNSVDIQLAWTAPERLQKRPKPFNRPCDVYSFGVIWYEIITGKKPWNGLHDEELTKVRMDLGKELTLEGASDQWHHQIQNLFLETTHMEPSQRPEAAIIVEKLGAMKPEELEVFAMGAFLATPPKDSVSQLISKTIQEDDMRDDGGTTTVITSTVITTSGIATKTHD